MKLKSSENTSVRVKIKQNHYDCCETIYRQDETRVKEILVLSRHEMLSIQQGRRTFPVDLLGAQLSGDILQSFVEFALLLPHSLVFRLASLLFVCSPCRRNEREKGRSFRVSVDRVRRARKSYLQ